MALAAPRRYLRPSGYCGRAACDVPVPCTQNGAREETLSKWVALPHCPIAGGLTQMKTHVQEVPVATDYRNSYH